MEPEWQQLNRSNWDERAAIHIAPGGYDLAPHRAGRGRLDPIAAATLGDVAGQRVVHLQCHIGDDSIAIAQAGAAEVLGVDFSPKALESARGLAAECGAGACRFALSDAQACAETLPEEAGRFDLAFASWGTITWLPDIRAWARSMAHFLKPGGRLAFVDSHPAALVFDGWEGAHPRWTFPYFARAPLPFDIAEDYANPTARLVQTRTIEFLHPLSDVIGALFAAGLRLEHFDEHDAIVWELFPGLPRGEDGYWRWPDKPWLPLSFSLRATKG